MADSIRHQDAAGESGAPLGVFDGDDLVELVPADDISGEATRVRVAARLGRGVEVLLVCPKHPTTAAVDCLVCVPED
jgi:hypothetical protein